MDQRQRFPGQRTRDRAPADLLPVGAGLLVAHQEVLIIDAGEVKVKLASIDAAGPDQTRMAKRSISDDHRQPMQPVVHNVVVTHFTNGIGAALSTQRDGDDHVARVDGSQLG